MANVFDVAAYILAKKGEMTAMKLQKLLYYSQAWSLVFDDEVMFSEKIEAWANGPVCPVYFAAHKGEYCIGTEAKGDQTKLSKAAKSTVDAVLKAYWPLTPAQLSERTHREPPWKNARKDVPDGERSSREITPAAMRDYYSSL